MHHYRVDETDVFYSEGAPTFSVTRPTLCIDATTGITYVNRGGGSTWTGGGGGGGAATLTATNTLTAADSGKILLLNSATEFATTLPALQAGLRFVFIVIGAPASASYTVVTAGSANVMIGGVYTNDFSGTTDSDFEATGGDTLTFVDAKAVKGDKAILECDGTNWHVTAFCSVFDAITITTAS